MESVMTPRVAPQGLEEVPMPQVEGVEHHWIQVNDLRMHYAEAGQGEPVVLLYGWPQHWWAWRELIGPLAERYRVICPDWRGMGWTQGTPDGYTWHGMALDLVD